MRFVFENGDPAGVRGMEALIHAFERWTSWRGALCVDCSDTGDQSGEVVRTVEHMQKHLLKGQDIDATVTQGPTQNEAAEYAVTVWIDAEAMVLAKAIPSAQAAEKREKSI